MISTESSIRNEVLDYARNIYGTQPEYLWASAPDYAVLRHSDNRKWYGLIMNITYDKIDPQKTGAVDILNVKLDDILFRDLLIQQEGYYIGYHIKRGKWIMLVYNYCRQPTRDAETRQPPKQTRPELPPGACLAKQCM